VILFEPHNNSRLYEAHIPEAMLDYNATTNTFTKEVLVDSTSMVMSPVDITQPDFQVLYFLNVLKFKDGMYVSCNQK